MACPLFRELRLGLFINPMADCTFSKVVFRNMDSMNQQGGDAFELQSLDDVGINTGQQGVMGGKNHLERDIELADSGSRTHNF
jgi:hypothetical protein